MIPSYGKVWQLGHQETVGIFDGEWTATEKVDGSQFSFLLHDGQLHFRSKGAVVRPEDCPDLFKPSVEGVTSLWAEGVLWPDIVYRGEAICRPKHNTLKYDRVPAFNTILFDVQNFGAYDERMWRGAALAWPGEWVPTIATLGVPSAKDMASLLRQESILGGTLIEGIVFKNYTKYDSFGHTLKAKYVSEAFKETHKGAWKQDNPGRGDVIQRLIEELRTSVRWEKAVQHLRDAGTLDGSPKDIGPLIAEVKRDIREEERDYIAGELAKWGMDQILRGATGGIAEWYKQQLAKEVLA